MLLRGMVVCSGSRRSAPVGALLHDALGQYMNRIFGEVDAFVHQVFARHLVDLRCQQPG